MPLTEHGQICIAKYLPPLVFLKKALQLDEQSNIAAALNRVPGVYMHTGSFNTNRITIRGIGSRNLFGTAKIRAFLDEIPLTNGTGETTLEDIDLSLVNNIDLIKGPTSSAYGAALGGIIRLNPDWETQGTALSIDNTLGSYNLQRNVVQYQYGKEGFSFRVGLNRMHSDGYRANNEYDRLGFTVLSSIKKERQRLTLLFNHIDLKSFIPSSLNETDYQNNPQRAAFIWAQIKGFEDYTKTLTGISYQTNITSKLSSTTSLFNTQFRSYESRPFNILRENSTVLGARTKFNQAFAQANYLEWGAEFFHENYDWQTNVTNGGTMGTSISINEETRQYLNIFLQSKWAILENMFLTAGVNYNATNYNLDNLFSANNQNSSGDYSFEPVVSPFLSAYYYPSFSRANAVNMSFYGIVGHGFSPPTLEETLTPDGVINPDIQPEKGWNFELGTRGNWENISYNLSVYTMQIKDLLVARRTEFDQFLGINAGKTTHQGIEFSLQSKHQCGFGNFNLFLIIPTPITDSNEFIDNDDDYSGNQLTGTAPHIASAGLLFETQGRQIIYGNFNYQLVDQMPLRDDNSVYSSAYQLWNGKLGYRIMLGKAWQIDAALGVNNLFDERYASMLLINAASVGGAAPRYYYPGLPRNSYGSLGIRYFMP
ncbi:MAG: TonB-dependent receptor [Saprospiraceae bacterium]|nr:TonB-dependent receptor [Saprospiraceae bacterium]